MTHVLTLVASQDGQKLTDKHFKDIADILSFYNIKYISRVVWLDKNIAGEVSLSGGCQSSIALHLRETLVEDKIDFFITENEKRQKKLLLADMDSTIVKGETLDDLSDHIGIKDEISKITAMAMNGKVDFEEALKARVQFLKDLEESALDETFEKLELNPGAETFIKTMVQNGAKCVLVSGGFTFFTEKVAELCGFHHHHGNVLEIKDGVMTGKVLEPILDKNAKLHHLENYARDLTLDLDLGECLTIGDGANDLPMLKAAGLGIGYHPKSAVQSEIHNCILYGDLTAALYAQGIAKKHFARL
ncbi:MAG: phosphoserine phosphatase SerB [Alphaproteobacteria bacterium]|nr:phosphoserine phosphatase SerB [Alphaproteobacteria bacterium]